MLRNVVLGLLMMFLSLMTATAKSPYHLVTFKFKNKQDRSKAADFVHLDVIKGNEGKAIVNSFDLKQIQKNIPTLISSVKKLDLPGPSIKGEEETYQFPRGDEKFHTYKELTEKLQNWSRQYPNITNLSSLGTTIQGKQIWILRLTHQNNLRKEPPPGIIFMGSHHAREHLSTEVPLNVLEHLLKNYGKNPEITKLVNERDIYYVPMVNPDGAMYDIKGRRYKMWRKNMRSERNNLYGVDLNRNYGYGWGGRGSSSSRRSDIFRGPKPFSEPETSAIKNFIEENQHVKIVLTYHTFSELILYPWGHKNEGVGGKDQQVFETMARKMATWTGYTPQRSSDLYVASGDTCDWAYGALKRFCFTFELTPRSQWEGGFYPGARVIDRVSKANIKPALYLIKHSKDPYGVL